MAGVAALAGVAGAGICEFTIQRDGGAWPATAGAVSLWPANQAPEQARVEVAASSGPVGSRVLWARTGDPMMLLFDTSGGAERYTVRIGETGAAAAPDWSPRAGLLLETRPRATGPLDTLPHLQKLWMQATNAFGRSLVPQIYDGTHRHARTNDFLSRYAGWLLAPRDGRYGFAIVANNASFLSIDGRSIVEWPGWHGVDGGRQGQHSGTVELKRGLHALEFWNAQREPGFAIGVAWQPPGASRFTILPVTAFAPVATFRVTDARGEAAAAAFSWEVVNHVQAGETGMIGMRFRALAAAPGDVCSWRFADGTEETNAECRHVFSREGLRRVELTRQRGGRVLGTLAQPVSVHPQWTQLAEFPEPVYRELRETARQAQLDREAPEDLAGFVRLADQVEDWEFLGVLANAVFARRTSFTGERAAILHRIGFYYQRPGVMQYDRVVAVWRAIIDDPSADAALRARTAAHLAGFLVHSGLDVAGGERLLQENAPDGQLNDVDRRLKTIFRGDARVLQGQREAAVACYRQAGNVVADSDTDYEVRRRGRIENARDYLRRKEFDAAEQVVRSLEWERPLERLELETGMLMIEVYRGRREKILALGVCRRLLAAAPADPRRSDLLLVAAEICRDLKRDTDCRALLAQLRKEHPYSEAAALAKDRFPEMMTGSP